MSDLEDSASIDIETGEIESAPETDVETSDTEETTGTEETTPVEKIKFKYKIDGKDEEEELTYDEAVARIRKSTAAERRFSEAHKIQQQARQIVAMMRDNPESALEALGFDVDKLAEERLYEKAKMKLMTPQQRQAYEMQAELQTLRNEKQSAAQKAKEEDQLKLDREEEQNFIKESSEALQLAGLPESPYLRTKIIEYANVARSRGYYDASPKDVLPFVIQDYNAEIRNLLSGMGEDKLLDFIGSSVADKVRKIGIQQIKQPTTKVPRSQGNQVEKPVKVKQSDRISVDDFLDKMLP